MKNKKLSILLLILLGLETLQLILKIIEIITR